LAELCGRESTNIYTPHNLRGGRGEGREGGGEGRGRCRIPWQKGFATISAFQGTQCMKYDLRPFMYVFPRSVRKGRKIHFKNICFAQSSTIRGLVFIMQPLTFHQDL
jgi:hypothetical protein